MDDINGNNGMEEEPVDEFGRPLRPNVDSSDSDSDRDYDRYRKRKDSRDRDGGREGRDGHYHHGGGGSRYSPDGGGRRRDHSPNGMGDGRGRKRSQSPPSHYRRGGPPTGPGRGRDDYMGQPPPIPPSDFSRRGSGGPSGTSMTSRGPVPNSLDDQQASPHTSIHSKPKRIQKRGDLFFDGQLKSFKQFLEYQDDSISQQDAEKKYEEYKLEFNKRQARIFFKEHQNEEWFKEKYEPSYLLKKRTEKLEKMPKLIESFRGQLSDPTLNFSLDYNEYLTKHSHHHHHQQQQQQNSNNNNNDNNIEQQQQAENKDIEMNGNSETSSAAVNTANSSSTNTSSTTTKPVKENTTLFIKSITPTCTKDELLEVLNKVGTANEPSVTKLILSEPVKYKNFNRFGWVTYKNITLSTKALKELNGTKMKDFDLHLIINKPSDEERLKLTPSIASTENRINADLDHAITLTNLFDQDKGITSNPLFTLNSWHSLTNGEKLDRLISYLRYVHFFCFYCCDEYNDECEVERRCGTIHLRKSLEEKDATVKETNGTTTTSSSTATTATEETEESKDKEMNDSAPTTDNDTTQEDKDKDTTNTATESSEMNVDQENNQQSALDEEQKKLISESDHHWINRLDNDIKTKINKINNEEQYTCNEMIQKAVEDYISTNTIKLEEEKFKCAICLKLFKGAEYVKKHINLKHPEEMKKQSQEEGAEEQFFVNYFSDPKRLTPDLSRVLGMPVQGGGAGMMFQGYQSHGVLPAGARPRWNPVIGQWEAPGGIGLVPPGMMMGGPIQIHNGMIPHKVGPMGSPIFTSPNQMMRGRSGMPMGGAVGGPIQMRGRPGQVNGSAGSSHQYPPGVVMPNAPRYRPYPSPQRSNQSMDPRGIREYVDLDAPLDTVPDIDYRSALKEYQNKKNS